MTLLKEKMQAAGVDTAQARLAVLAIAALQESGGSLITATESLFRKLSKEPWAAKWGLLRPYLIERQADMRGERSLREQALVAFADVNDYIELTVRFSKLPRSLTAAIKEITFDKNGCAHIALHDRVTALDALRTCDGENSNDRSPAESQVSDTPSRPIVERRQPSPERKRAIANIVHRAAKTILFKHLTSDGRDWARVGAHELDGMDRDGVVARAVKPRLGALSNEQRFKELGELMTPTAFNEVKASLVS